MSNDWSKTAPGRKIQCRLYAAGLRFDVPAYRVCNHGNDRPERANVHGSDQLTSHHCSADRSAPAPAQKAIHRSCNGRWRMLERGLRLHASSIQVMDASSCLSRAASPAGRPAARPARGGSDLLLSVLSAGDVAMWGASATRSGARCALRCAWRPARAAACAWPFTGAASARSHEQDKKTSPWNLPFVSMLGGLGCAARPVRSSLSLSLLAVPL